MKQIMTLLVFLGGFLAVTFAASNLGPPGAAVSSLQQGNAVTDMIYVLSTAERYDKINTKPMQMEAITKNAAVTSGKGALAVPGIAGHGGASTAVMQRFISQNVNATAYKINGAGATMLPSHVPRRGASLQAAPLHYIVTVWCMKATLTGDSRGVYSGAHERTAEWTNVIQHEFLCTKKTT